MKGVFTWLAATLMLIVCSLVAAAGVQLPGSTAAEIRQQLAELPAVFEENWYQIEVLVFARSADRTQEFWRLDRPIVFPEQHIVPGVANYPPGNRPEVLVLQPTDQDHGQASFPGSPRLPDNADRRDRQAIDHDSWRFLATAEREFEPVIERMIRTGSYKKLFHETWVQPVRERRRALSLYISGGDMLAPAISVTVDPERAFDDNAPLYTDQPDVHDEAQPIGQPELQGTLLFSLSRYLHLDSVLWLTTESAEGQRYHLDMTQSRRMRSNETHYIDHPLFGLIVRITPWKHPLQMQKEELDKKLRELQVR